MVASCCCVWHREVTQLPYGFLQSRSPALACLCSVLHHPLSPSPWKIHIPVPSFPSLFWVRPGCCDGCCCFSTSLSTSSGFTSCVIILVLMMVRDDGVHPDLRLRTNSIFLSWFTSPVTCLALNASQGPRQHHYCLPQAPCILIRSYTQPFPGLHFLCYWPSVQQDFLFCLQSALGHLSCWRSAGCGSGLSEMLEVSIIPTFSLGMEFEAVN